MTQLAPLTAASAYNEKASSLDPRGGLAMHPDTDIDSPKSNSFTNTLLVLVLLLLAGVLGWRILHPRQAFPAMSHPGVGHAFSPVVFEPLLNTESAVQPADLQGKIALINIWGPWCNPCLMELPELLELGRKFRDGSDVKILLVSSDGGAGQPKEELASDTQEAMQRFNSRLPMYYDPRGKIRSAVVTSAHLDQFGYPTTIIVDRKGIIRGIWMGFSETGVEEMHLLLKQLTSEQSS